MYKVNDFKKILGYPSESSAVNLFKKCFPVYPIAQRGQTNATYWVPIASILQRVYSHSHTPRKPTPGRDGKTTQKQVTAHKTAWARQHQLEHIQAAFDGYILDMVLAAPLHKGMGLGLG